MAFCAAMPLLAQNLNEHNNIDLVKIHSGSFIQGGDGVTLSGAQISGMGVSSDRPARGDYDEYPAHRVTLSHDFLIASHLISAEEYQKFDPSYKPSAAFSSYASGISYEQAVAFCKWLSAKEGKHYRLPTEAEWEYVERADTQTPYFTGAAAPAAGTANPWGVVMGEGTPEWIADWYGPYTATAQTDPTGAATGLFRVVRGGGLDSKEQKSKEVVANPSAIYPAMAPFFARSANRASMAPSYASAHGNIGFRVVQADDPAANLAPVTPLFFQTGVKQTAADFTKGPHAAKPFYHEHEIFPNLGGKSMPEVGWKLGLAQGLGINYHNSAVQVLANGDVVAAYYNTPNKEDDPDQTIMMMRRRAGSEEWDMPEPWPFFADAANAAPVFWKDHGKLWLFWGFPRLIGAPPFTYTQSDDNGVTWKPVEFPHFTAPVGRYVSQPINSIVRTQDGTILIPTDATGKDADGNSSVSVVWGTHDEGKTWYDAGGRTAGRHTTIVLAQNGDILGFGGKNSNIGGRMPLATSSDGGKTWTKSKTDFDVLASGERPSVIRLASGRLFFVADYNPKVQKHIHKDGAYVALSGDDGKTWSKKKLPENIVTVGYVTSTQGPDGVIHIVTSKNPVNVEIELNEAWVLDVQAGKSAEATSNAKRVQHSEKWPHGTLKATWSTVQASDGRTLLEGPQTLFDAQGHKQWTSAYHLGRKIGEEVFYRADGSIAWKKTHAADGSWSWTVYDATGKQTAESHWNNMTLASDSISAPVQ
ncbi:exo-alpha-sialidase [Telmatobacter bradus]|uniref:exo-alpha-sialidase n=1 Tax=Telmatobacter bradus TaxID=474953 RepID=UPI003B429ABD